MARITGGHRQKRRRGRGKEEEEGRRGISRDGQYRLALSIPWLVFPSRIID